MDADAAVLKREHLIGAVEALGLSRDDVEKVMAKVEKRAPETEWKELFPEKAN